MTETALPTTWNPADGAPLPDLEGTLVVDRDSLRAAGRDLGNIRFARPGAVLRPASVTDVAAMVAFCHRHGIPVAARGTGHAMHGQALVDGGLVVDMTTLATVHSVSAYGGVDVDAGACWSGLVARAAELGLAFPCLTGYLDLTVAGTLSVGGIGGAYTRGAQIDHVRALQVVTGTGEIVWCGRDEHRDLFDAVLGGLGQFGIITRAVLDVRPAPESVLTLRLPYTDPATAVDTMTMLARRREFDELFGMAIRPDPAGPPVYVVSAVVHGDPAPDVEHLLRDVPPAAMPVPPETGSYLQHATQYTVEINQLRHGTDWDRRVKPWFDVFVPASAAAEVVTEVIAPLPAEAWAPGSFVLLFPRLRDGFARPQLRLPADDDVVYLLDVLDAHPAGPGVTEELERRNQEWFERAVRPRGGVRYPIGVLRFTEADWQTHYGDRWATVRDLKDRYDPRGLLARGQGIFT